MRAGSEKIKSALCSERHSEQLLFSTTFLNIYRFQDGSGRKFIILALLIPDDVIHDPTDHLVGWRYSRLTISLL